MSNGERFKILINITKTFWDRFILNIQGVASIEFAIISPAIALLFIGIVQLSWGLTVNRRVHQISNLTGDLIARTPITSSDELEGIFRTHSLLMRPYDIEPLKMIATHVVADLNSTSVCWSYTNSTDVAAYQTGATYELPEEILNKGESLIVIESEYLYRPILFSLFVNEPITFREKLFHAPRTSTTITLDGQEC
ncbi:MAG: pilus assembly protein [Hyphomicrobiaceae bacterium]|nr:pilus assembly protein [Hyphomicrobiaceae bacterium]